MGFRRTATRSGFMAVLLGALAIALGVAGCSSGGENGGSEDEPLTLGNTTFEDRGTAGAAGAMSLALDAGDFFFAPTFIQGGAGMKLTLEIGNASRTIHNFSLTAQGVDKDILAGEKATVNVTFPASGVLLFACKYHTGQAMNGELIAGTGAPAPPPS